LCHPDSNNTQRPDLAPKTLELNKTVANAGDTFNLTFDISNLGSATKVPFNAAFYLSKDNVLDSSDLELGYTEIDPLAARSSTGPFEFIDDFVLPGVNNSFWQGDGNYNIIMKVDSDNAVAESNELNNLAIDNIVINNTRQADLTGKVLDVNGALLNAGDAFNLTFDVANLGGSTNTPFNVSFYLSGDQTINGSDFLLRTITIDPLAANSSTGTLTLTQDLLLPGINNSFWKGDGNYFVGMVVDSANGIRETNEANNVSIDSVQIVNTQKADLTAKTFNVIAPSANAGDRVNLEFDISNLGGPTNAPFSISFYLSADKVIGGSSDQLLRTITIDPLAANSSTGLLTLTEDLLLPGINDSFWSNGNNTYYIGMQIDSGNAIAEISETNNTFADSITINKAVLRGTRNNDDLIGSAAGDIMRGDRGDDDLWGYGGNDSLYGQRGDDDLYGGIGNDYLHGGFGDDYLIGVDESALNPGAGEVDTLVGGYGSDVFFLGNEKQAFYLAPNVQDYAVITDFNVNEDLIVLNGDPSKYTLGASLPGLPTGIAIYDRNNETIGIIQGANANNLNLSADYFEYV
jgi:subtilase family serine protease